LLLGRRLAGLGLRGRGRFGGFNCAVGGMLSEEIRLWECNTEFVVSDDWKMAEGDLCNSVLRE